MDELKQGFNDDLSKTFDDDEVFNKVMHRCTDGDSAGQERRLTPGTRCPYCGQLVGRS